jgi:putative alpha-1,2-mannosidase
MGMVLAARGFNLFTDLFGRLIGNGGIAPSHTGGMSPTTGPPFAMQRWVAQTRHNYVSRLAYNITASTPQIHGFQCTMQPAIWMGESRSHAIVPGVASTGNPTEIKSNFTDRGLFFVGGPEKRGNEVISPGYYSIELEDGVGGTVFAEMTSSEWGLVLTLVRIS